MSAKVSVEDVEVIGWISEEPNLVWNLQNNALKTETCLKQMLIFFFVDFFFCSQYSYTALDESHMAAHVQDVCLQRKRTCVGK